MSNNKPLPDKRNVNPSELKDSIKGSLNKKSIIINAIAYGLIYLGCPKQVAHKIAPYIYRILVYILTMIPIFLIVILLSLFSLGGEKTKNYTDLPKSVTTVTSAAASKYKVPETILIGLLQYQTNFGTKSPYDTIEHDNLNGVLEPAIGDSKDENQGLGFYLYSPNFLKNNPELDFDPQNFSESTLATAYLIREQMNYFKARGISEPTSFKVSDQYWAEILNNLPIADPSVSTWACQSGSLSLPKKISEIWSCELKKNGSRIYYQNQDNPEELNRLLTSQSTPIIVNDALNFAWNYNKSKKPNIQNWEDINLSSCSDRFGIFPISTKDNPEKLDVCNAVINIDLAAKQFVKNLNTSNLKLESNKAYGYGKLFAGWSYFYDLIGVNYLSNLENGPYVGKIQDACIDQINAYLTNVPLTFSIGENFVDFVRSDKMSPVKNSFCSNVSSDDLIFELYHIIKEFNSADKDIDPVYLSILKELELYVKINFTPSNNLGFIPRLASSPLISELPLDNSIENNVSTLGYKILGASMLYGSTTSGDKRAGTNPYQSIGVATDGSFNMLTLTRIDPMRQVNIPSRSDPRLVRVVCKSSREDEYAIAIYDVRWENLCVAAKMAGINLYVNSSYRTAAEQIALANDYAGQNRVASPGNSAHEKGVAMDIGLGSSDGLEGDSKKEFAWLHSIVGCYNKSANTYRGLPLAYKPTDYVNNINAGGVSCAANELPVKRMQTYGLTPLCLNHYSTIENWSDIAVILCKYETMKSSGSGQKREPWHFDLGLQINVNNLAPPTSQCGSLTFNAEDKKEIAVYTKTFWLCKLSELGFAKISSDGSTSYLSNLNEKTLAEQVSSEAVVVSYCASSFDTQYKLNARQGLFALDSKLDNQSNLFDGKSNIQTAFNVWLSNYQANKYYHGWDKFLHVDSSVYLEDKKSKFPILGRFDPQTPSPSIGKKNQNVLPDWATDPESNFIGNESCKDLYNGQLS